MKTEIRFNLNKEGKISIETMRALFAAIVETTPSLQGLDMSQVRQPGSRANDAFVGFLVGCRCYERIMRAGGIEVEVCEGRSIVHKER